MYIHHIQLDAYQWLLLCHVVAQYTVSHLLWLMCNPLFTPHHLMFVTDGT